MTRIVEGARRWLTAHHIAQLGVLVQMLAGLRTVGEYFRLQWVGAAAPDVIEPLLFAAMLAIGGAFVSVVLYFFGHERAVIGLAVLVIAGLIVYKLIALPALG